MDRRYSLGGKAKNIPGEGACHSVSKQNDTIYENKQGFNGRVWVSTKWEKKKFTKLDSKMTYHTR